MSETISFTSTAADSTISFDSSDGTFQTFSFEGQVSVGPKGETGDKGDKGDTGDPGIIQEVNGYSTTSVTLGPDDLDDTSTTHKFVTSAEKTKLSNLSGTNTGDQDLSGYVPTSRTVNSKALSSNVTLTQDDVGDGSTYKQYSSTEKTKLSGIASGATANDTDSNLKNRANHTGTQALSTISDVTATASEVNVLDGITATTTELNYTDGVTSAIQTQLDTKAATTYVDAGDATKQPKFMTGTSATTNTTQAKTVTLDAPWASYTPVAGDYFQITFTNGVNVANPTLNINGTGAKAMGTPGATDQYSTYSGGAYPVLLIYNGTDYRMVSTSAQYNEITASEVIDTAHAGLRTITGRRLETLMVNEATKSRTLTNKTITSPLVNKILDTNGNNAMQFNATASAVNYAFFVNGAAGNSVSMRANGSDTNIPFALFSKGSGQVQLRSDTNGFLLTADAVASGVNYVALTNSATGTGPTISSTGTDTDVHLNLTAKGAGNIQVPTGTGITLYNTSDQTTNYEKVTQGWSGNIYTISTLVGGTGTARYLRLGTSATAGSASPTRFLDLVPGGSNTFSFTSPSSLAGNIMTMTGIDLQGASVSQTAVAINPQIHQSGTSSYTALLVNPTETTTGSGAKLLADFQVGGTSKVSIKNDGVIFPVQAATASAPTYVKGGIYFDTTLNKLRVGGAIGWETVSSL